MSSEGMKVQRYDMILTTRCGEGWQELQPEPEGDWMRYEDHVAALALEREAGDQMSAALKVAKIDVMYKRDYSQTRQARKNAETTIRQIDAALAAARAAVGDGK